MKYFTIEELVKSETAKNLKIDNTPNQQIIDNLTILVDECLDVIREKCGFPIYVNSGYRCKELNNAVCGDINSNHLRGCAVDIRGKNDDETKKIFEVAENIGVYNELLLEKNKNGKIWVHISHLKNGDKHKINNNYIAK